ncbi:hypothetical protein [Paractinoplanes deccanensis]|nr:hypothetical protein [Actinoplanes deccanensis]
MTDYFRAHSVPAIQAELTLHEGDQPATVGDWVAAKSVEPTVVLGQLIAFARDEPWTPATVNDRLVWPEGGEQDTTHEGPWITVLDDATRDTLATIPDDRVPALAARWATIEEVPPAADAAYLAELMAELIALARRARESGDSLLCWMSL